MVASISLYVEEVRPDVPGAPDVVIKKEIVKAWRKFFSESRYWREFLTDIAVTGDSGVVDYALTPPAGFDIVDIDHVNDQNDEEYKEYTIHDGFLTLNEEPVADMTLKVNAILTPLLTAVTIPDEIHNKWFEELCSGAKGRILSRKDKSFYDPNLAMVHLDFFTGAVEDAQVKSMRQYGKARKNHGRGVGYV